MLAVSIEKWRQISKALHNFEISGVNFKQQICSAFSNEVHFYFEGKNRHEMFLYFTWLYEGPWKFVFIWEKISSLLHHLFVFFGLKIFVSRFPFSFFCFSYFSGFFFYGKLQIHKFILNSFVFYKCSSKFIFAIS